MGDDGEEGIELLQAVEGPERESERDKDVDALL